MQIAGTILAGGLSRRMGGGDKTLLPLGSGVVLDAVVARLSPQVDALALNANGDPGRFDRFSLPILADTVDGYAGPLAGVLSGMIWGAQAVRSEAVVTAAGDTPFFPLDLVRRLAGALADDPRRVAVAQSGGRLHPTFAFWPVALRDELEAFLARGETFRVTAFLDAVGYQAVDFEADGGADPFFNINTAADLETARTRIAGGHP